MNLDAATLHWPHDRVHVRMLQQAHADHIESLYHAMAAVSGNSAGVHIETVGRVRTFIAEGRRLENRAIFLGDESPDEIDAVLAHFARHRANLVVEVNPANYYVNPPATWEKRLLRHLLSRGCCIDDFRCVWCCTALDGVEAATTDRLRRFGADQTDEFFVEAIKVEPDRRWNEIERAAERREGLIHYVGHDDGQPACVGSLFVHGPIAYLSWWFTRPEFRGRGFQQEGIRRRLRDAAALGCHLAFTVTDFNFTSPANVQRCGMSLAYNYLLVRRDADQSQA